MHSTTEWVFLLLHFLMLCIRTKESYLSETLETTMSDYASFLEMHSINFLYLATLFTWHL